jgi:hypothetical protein
MVPPVCASLDTAAWNCLSFRTRIVLLAAGSAAGAAASTTRVSSTDANDWVALIRRPIFTLSGKEERRRPVDLILVRIVLFLAFGAAVVFVIGSGKLPFQDPRESAAKSEKSIRGVAEMLGQATEKGPPGQPRATGRWASQLRRACATREQRLAALAKPSVLDRSALARHADNVLSIHRAYARRVSSLRSPAELATDARQIQRDIAAQERALAGIAVALRSANLKRASQEALVLRELAGRANALLVRLDLTGCALRPSSMPL